tara:strand:- start:500 stop:970 length:471 start_codon:yes stop_codon:yes gene_type:complete
MAFKLNGNTLAVDVAFKTSDGTQYPANWLRLSTAKEKTDLGIAEVDDPKTYDSRFYNDDGSAKALDGVKSVLKAQEKETAKSLLNLYDWQVVRKAEKGTALDTNVATFRDGIRTAYTTRKTEIDNCADTAALVTLYGTKEDNTPNMTQYPEDPNSN